MRASGYEPEDFEDEVVEVWPENWSAFYLFSRLRTQWLSGFSGATGLNHPSVFKHIDRMKLSDEEADLMFDDIYQMELAALNEMRQGQ